MQCERCNKKKVTVIYRENINGKARAFRLCGDCATAMQQTGELEDLSSALARLSSDWLLRDEDIPWRSACSSLPAHLSVSAPERCCLCGTEREEVWRTGRVGCTECYRTFESILTARVSHSLPVEGYRGRLPLRVRREMEYRQKLSEWKAQLELAVADQRYEEAATLRDRIREAEASPSHNNGKDGQT